MSDAIIGQRIDMATSIAMKVWEMAPVSSASATRPNVAIGIYTPYGSITGIPEWFVTISDGPPGTGLFYFGRRRQIYVVTNFKCVRKLTSSAAKTPYYEIIPSEDDIQIGKSPLRPIGCSVHEKDPVINAQRLFALDFVYDEVKKSGAMW
jgi:hypothetical protein